MGRPKDMAVPHTNSVAEERIEPEGPNHVPITPGELACPFATPVTLLPPHHTLFPCYLTQLGNSGDVSRGLGTLIRVVFTKEVVNLVLVRLFVP